MKKIASMATLTLAAISFAGTAPAHASSTKATTALSTLSVKASGSKSGYSRAQFGTAWSDNQNDLWGHNGCDTRNDILRRDLSVKVLGSVSSCKHVNLGIVSGVLHDPYTNTYIGMRRSTNASAIQIDHVVALGNAWISGASSWSAAQRLAYANDPLVLLAAQGSANERKGDSDASAWLPSNTSYQACYVARQIEVKSKYHLSVTLAEKSKMASILAKAPNTTLPEATSNHC